jgi:hypothetical protein
MIAVSLIVVAVIFPLALGMLGAAGNVQVVNGSGTAALSDLVDGSIITLISVLLPIVAIVGVLIYYIPKS